MPNALRKGTAEAVYEQGSVLRFGVYPALRVVPKETLHEIVVTPTGVSESLSPVMVGLLRDTSCQLAQTFNVTMLKLIQFTQSRFSGLSLGFTEVPPGTKLLQHAGKELVRDGFMDGLNASHASVGYDRLDL
jgi:hypothetical protein